MLKLFKLNFYFLFVLVGLYFFGNFRINDTNIRDFLQTKITMQNIRIVKNEASQFYKMLKLLYENMAGEKAASNKAGDADQIKNPFSSVPLDNLSSKDRKQMLKLLQDIQHTDKK